MRGRTITSFGQMFASPSASFSATPPTTQFPGGNEIFISFREKRFSICVRNKRTFAKYRDKRDK
jgi:hypothetical protein